MLNGGDTGGNEKYTRDAYMFVAPTPALWPIGVRDGIKHAYRKANKEIVNDVLFAEECIHRRYYDNSSSLYRRKRTGTLYLGRSERKTGRNK